MDDLNAGPELDRMIAERVMGWARTSDGHCWSGQGVCVSGWSPSTNIAHAWEVVERLLPDWTFQLKHGSAEHWIATFRTAIVYHAHADTAPLAICRAALRRLEADLS